MENGDDVINLFGETNDGSAQLRIGFNNYYYDDEL